MWLIAQSNNNLNDISNLISNNITLQFDFLLQFLIKSKFIVNTNNYDTSIIFFLIIVDFKQNSLKY